MEDAGGIGPVAVDMMLRGLGQNATASIWNTPGCTLLDALYLSQTCEDAMNQSFYGPVGVNVPSLPTGAGSAPLSVLTDPSDPNNTAAQTASNNAALAAWQNSVAAANSCPAGSHPNSSGVCVTCGILGTSANGDCTAIPWWAIALAVGGTALLLVVAVK